MKDLLLPLITTRSGWAFRQVLKGITVASASLATWLSAHGASADHAAAIAAGAAAALTWGAEFGLSKLARHVVTPCLALFLCLSLTSCGSTTGGEKTFGGITAEGWMNAGKAALTAAAIEALQERQRVAAKNPVNVQP